MPKMPDLGKLAGKIDVQGFVSNLKSLVTVDTRIPEPEGDDELGLKLSQISKIAHELVEVQAKQVDQLATLSTLVKSVYDQLGDTGQVTPIKSKSESSTQSSKTEAKPDAEAKKSKQDSTKTDD